MNNYSINVVWSEEDQSYVATSPEFQHLSAVGGTQTEAFNEFQDVLEAAIEIYNAEGWELPKPKGIQSYSGQFRVRIPKGLHGRLAQQAEFEGVSLNTLVVSYLSAGLGEHSKPARDTQDFKVFVGPNNARIEGGSPVAVSSSTGLTGFQWDSARVSSFYVDNKARPFAWRQSRGEI